MLKELERVLLNRTSRENKKAIEVKRARSLGKMASDI